LEITKKELSFRSVFLFFAAFLLDLREFIFGIKMEINGKTIKLMGAFFGGLFCCCVLKLDFQKI
jgi:hypothetical protein